MPAYPSEGAEEAPQTQIWFLLYAQLRRVDGQAYRNLLLAKLLGQQPNQVTTGPGFNNPVGNQITPHDTPSTAGIPQIQSIPVQAAFSVAEVDTILTELLLPTNTPLSVLAVELFNLESQVIREPAGGPTPKLEAASVSGGESSSGTATAIATPEATTFLPAIRLAPSSDRSAFYVFHHSRRSALSARWG